MSSEWQKFRFREINHNDMTEHCGTAFGEMKNKTSFIFYTPLSEIDPRVTTITKLLESSGVVNMVVSLLITGLY